MGDSASKAALTVQDSPSGDGLKSLISAPLDEFITSEKFWELYEKQARAGVTMPFMGKLTGAGVSKHECRDLEAGSFEIDDVVNGGVFSQGEFNLRMRHKFDKDKKEWTTTMFDKSFADSEIKETITIRELSSPMRIEAWTNVVEQRDSSNVIAGIESAILSQVIKRAGVDSTPVCKDGAPASDGKTCALSEALDASISPDKFWALYVGLIKEGITKPGKTEHKCQDVDNNNFVIIDTFENGLVTYEKFTFDAAKDLLLSVTHENDESMSEFSAIASYNTKVLRDPLRVEFYKDVLSGRKTHTELLGVLQAAIDSCLSGAEPSSGSWFG